MPSTQVQTVPTETTIDIGTQVRSIPGPDEQSQTYETVEKIVARAEWNVIKSRMTEPQDLDVLTTRIFLEGTSALLKPGDGLLLFPEDSSNPIFREVAEVIPYPEEKYSKVVLEALSADHMVSVKEANPEYKATPAASAMVRKKNPGSTAGNPTKQVAAKAQSVMQKKATVGAIEGLVSYSDYVQANPPRVLAFRLRAAIFGHNAPTWDSLPNFQKYGQWTYQSEDEYDFVPGVYAGEENKKWVETTLDKYHGEPSGSKNIYLDNAYPAIVKDGWIVLQNDTTSQPYQVDGATELSKADFTLNAKVTRLTLNTHTGLEKFHIRETTVWAQSEELKLARQPIEKPVSGATIDLNRVVAGLTRGQKVIIGGKLDASLQDIVYETGVIDDIEEIEGPEKYTRITLVNELQNSYLRHTVTINANVVLATHGERVREILGSGDATQGFQKFSLRHAPLTYVSSSKPGGAQSTLEVRVNELLWEEVPSLFGHGPNERIYCTFPDDSGKTIVQFGDGVTGARLPTGRENVVASYRKGIGLGGLVKPKQIILLFFYHVAVKTEIYPCLQT